MILNCTIFTKLYELFKSESKDNTLTRYDFFQFLSNSENSAEESTIDAYLKGKHNLPRALQASIKKTEYWRIIDCPYLYQDNRRMSNLANNLIELHKEYIPHALIPASADEALSNLTRLCFCGDYRYAYSPRFNYSKKTTCRNIIGRDSLAKAFHEQLLSKRIVVLYGEVGIGKTTFLNEYYTTHKNTFKDFYYIKYDTDIAYTLSKIKYFYTDKNNSGIEKLKSIIADALLVIDDCNCNREMLQAVLNTLERTQLYIVLITRTLYKADNSFLLPPLEPSAQQQLFTQYYGDFTYKEMDLWNKKKHLLLSDNTSQLILFAKGLSKSKCSLESVFSKALSNIHGLSVLSSTFKYLNKSLNYTGHMRIFYRSCCAHLLQELTVEEKHILCFFSCIPNIELTKTLSTYLFISNNSNDKNNANNSSSNSDSNDNSNSDFKTIITTLNKYGFINNTSTDGCFMSQVLADSVFFSERPTIADFKDTVEKILVLLQNNNLLLYQEDFCDILFQIIRHLDNTISVFNNPNQCSFSQLQESWWSFKYGCMSYFLTAAKTEYANIFIPSLYDGKNYSLPYEHPYYLSQLNLKLLSNMISGTANETATILDEYMSIITNYKNDSTADLNKLRIPINHLISIFLDCIVLDCIGNNIYSSKNKSFYVQCMNLLDEDVLPFEKITFYHSFEKGFSIYNAEESLKYEEELSKQIMITKDPVIKIMYLSVSIFFLNNDISYYVQAGIPIKSEMVKNLTSQLAKQNMMLDEQISAFRFIPRICANLYLFTHGYYRATFVRDSYITEETLFNVIDNCPSITPEEKHLIQSTFKDLNME